jgi:hypothetical protein
MAASKSRRVLPGFSRSTRESSTLIAGVPATGKTPSGHVYQDGDGNDWYLWVDNAGAVRVLDAATVEAAGFAAWNTAGAVLGAKTLSLQLIPNMSSAHVFVADRAYRVVSVQEIHSVVGGASAAVQPRKITDTSSPGSAASATVKELTTAAISLTTTVNTVQTGTLVATAADLLFAAGDKLALNFSGTTTGLAGVLTITLVPVG